ncbi:MAG TPA: nitrogen fixation protein NifX [Paenibacillaceae bacterium]|nr:nitrogen fixation protein NifX [Paenibacillaceae bacterium]
MKVAFATDDEKVINSHFGKCELFIIYDITPEKYSWYTTRYIANENDDDEYGRIDKRVDAMSDCSLVFITQIGPTAAAKVTKKKIMPIKVESGTEIVQQLDRLLLMLQNKPPLWLAKIMNQESKNQEEVI